jgi:hypothetical protein
MGKKMNKKTFFTLLGLLLVAFAIIPKVDYPNIIPTPTPVVNLDIDKPTDDIIKLVSTINKSVKDPQDRLKMAVFNYSFSKRVNNYSTQTQKINDIYVLAAENFFGESIRGKYPNLPSELKNLFITAFGENNHIITPDEKVATTNIFSGLAWSLIK